MQWGRRNNQKKVAHTCITKRRTPQTSEERERYAYRRRHQAGHAMADEDDRPRPRDRSMHAAAFASGERTLQHVKHSPRRKNKKNQNLTQMGLCECIKDSLLCIQNYSIINLSVPCLSLSLSLPTQRRPTLDIRRAGGTGLQRRLGFRPGVKRMGGDRARWSAPR